MPKSPEKLNESVSLRDTDAVELPAPASLTDVPEDPVAESQDPRDTAPAVAEEAPPVKVKLADDFENEGDVFISIAFAGDAGDEDDRIPLTGSALEVPAEVAAQLVESPAVEVVD